MKIPGQILRLFAFICSTTCLVLAKRNNVMYCGACLGLVDEVDHGISTTDTKKTVQVGSFRINSQGKQDLNTIPLKRSELHLMELLENACPEVGQYIERSVPESGKSNFIRPDSRDGVRVSRKHSKDDEHMRKVLKFACDTLIEEHEEEIIEMYKNEAEDVHSQLCVELAGVCIKANISEQREAHGEAVSNAILEEADRMAKAVAAAAETDDDDDEEDEEDGDDDEEVDDEGDDDDEDKDAQDSEDNDDDDGEDFGTREEL